MLQEQKHLPSYFLPKTTIPSLCLNKINNDCTRLKLLLNSFRDRSLRQDESLGDDSDLSKKEVMTENRSLRHERVRNQGRERLSGLYQTGYEIGDKSLPSRHVRKGSNAPDGIEVSRLIHKGDEGIQLNLFAQNKSQLPFGRDSSANKPSQYLVSPNKKPSSFRITSKIQTKRKLLDQLCQKQAQTNEEQTFEVQSINANYIIAHLNSIRELDIESNPEQIFAFFESIYNLGRFSPARNPVIKRYRSCVYYGDKPCKDKREGYRGIIWSFKRVLYYGEMLQGRKHGVGIEIFIGKDVIVWKGRFQNGLKNGYFTVQSNQKKYYGMLKDGQYHGEGHLITSTSQYKGGFCQGIKQGQGWQKMANKSEYKGEYFNNRFDGNGELKAQGYYYQGIFKCGKPDGRGFERTEHYEYLGDYVMGVKSGKGKIKIRDGVTMTSQFLNGLAVDENVRNTKDKLALEGNLSKELRALNEESEQGTIDGVLNIISKA